MFIFPNEWHIETIAGQAIVIAIAIAIAIYRLYTPFPEIIADFSKKYIILSKVYTDESGVK